MADLQEILDQYPEEILLNKLTGKIVIGAVNWEKKQIVILLEKIEPSQILFKQNGKALRIQFNDNKIKEMKIDEENMSFFNLIFWISDYHDNHVEVKYLQCGHGQKFNSNLDIGFGDNIVQLIKGTIGSIGTGLSRDFVFKAGDLDFIFVQTYPNSDRNFTIYGRRKRGEIIQTDDNKWIIQKIVDKPFPKKHGDFLQLNVAQYNSVNFVESSKASEAYETIKAEEAKGNTLIALWKTYSKIELERSQQLKDKIGGLKFHKLRNMADGITRIKILSDREELRLLINENKEDILNMAFELSIEQEFSTSSSNSNRFNIKTINPDFSIDIFDDLNTLPENGTLEVSLIGDEIVNKRRERALRSLREDRKLITRNLLFAIEGATDAMLIKKRNEKPITDRTRKFLKAKFGIDDLTPNQKNAVEIAINTPDIAIIQGPPGTGKSTVVAAICDRLIEIAEKERKNSNSKLILVSAFQNDTVEHIASKIYTFGLPTIKIGKETQGNVRAEDKFIEELKLNIDYSLQSLSSQSNSHRTSKQLKDIKAIYETEKNDSNAKERIGSLLKSEEIDEPLWNSWKDLNADKQFNTNTNDKNRVALKGLRTELQSYNDDGYEKTLRILNTDIPFSENEVAFLASSPLEEPKTEFLAQLKDIKEKYLEEINAFSNTISLGNDLGLISWLEESIQYFKSKEELSYDDEETFVVSNLEALREDLDGNADYIRDTIKDYGESLAATNQVAGSKEMSFYQSIDNVILEEAARSNPLDLLIPMSKATERIIMVGDQNQLPHLLEDDIADETSIKLSDKFQISETRKKLEESLFGVIFKNLSTAKPKRTITLVEQFRMHPFIGDFISKVYYNGELIPGLPNQADLKNHGLELNWIKNKVAVFCDVKRQYGPEISGKSKSRSAEAIRIIKLLDELKADLNFENLSIGIITFYATQVEGLYKEAAKKGYAEYKPDGSYEISKQYKETNDGREKLRIGTVDSFQGKEFDIVILSTVRSNNISRIHENQKKVFGFLTLGNRLNVAFSRSQKLLIVVGDGSMFSDDFAKTYVEGLYEFYTQLSTHNLYGIRIQ